MGSKKPGFFKDGAADESPGCEDGLDDCLQPFPAEEEVSTSRQAPQSADEGGSDDGVEGDRSTGEFDASVKDPCAPQALEEDAAGAQLPDSEEDYHDHEALKTHGLLAADSQGLGDYKIHAPRDPVAHRPATGCQSEASTDATDDEMPGREEPDWGESVRVWLQEYGKGAGLVAGGVAMMAYALFGGSPPQLAPAGEGQSSALARVAEGGDRFPQPGFVESTQGVVTNSEVDALLHRYRAQKGPQASVVAAGDKTAGARMYTAEEVAQAIAAARRIEKDKEPAAQRPSKTAAAAGRSGRRRASAAKRQTTASATRQVHAKKPVEAETRAERRGRLSLAWFAAPTPSSSQPASTMPAGAGAEGDKVSFALGARIAAELELGISSVRHGVVLARTLREATAIGGRVVPARSLLRGRSSSSGDRVFIDFDRLTTPDAKTYRLRGMATSDRLPGIAAVVRKMELHERTQSRLGDGALEALKGVAGAFAGPLGDGLKRGSDGAIGEVQRELRPDRSVVLEVAAGTRFELVVNENE